MPKKLTYEELENKIRELENGAEARTRAEKNSSRRH